MAKTEDIVSEVVKELLELLNQKKNQFGIEEDKENQALVVKIQSDNPGPLIGRQGRNLDSLQFLLNLILWRRTEGKSSRLIVDINNYRQEQKEKATFIAQEAALKVKTTKKKVYLPPMSAFERRIIHLALGNDPEIETISQDEGPQRHVVVRLKK